MAEFILIKRLMEEDKQFIQKTLDCGGNEVFDIVEDRLYLPFSFARKSFVIPDRNINTTESMKFTGVLREEQLRVKNFVVEKLTSSTSPSKSAIVSACPGFGKTITSLAVACFLGVKTAILVNKLILIDQWIDSVGTFIPNARVQTVTARTKKLDTDANFYIVNAVNAKKHSHDFWKCCKFVIVDELHQIVTNKLVVSLLRFVPDCILGLSATPYRHDEYDKAIKWFFGDEVTGNKLDRKHTFRIVDTNWYPCNVRYTAKGMDWGRILEDQSQDASRNDIIVRECIRELEDGRVILILVKRVQHAVVLKEKLQAHAKVETLIKSEKTFDKSCRVLIGTTSKIGVGFDHAPINCLIVASDVKNYFVQFLGRCMRKQEGEPTVVDFNDNFGTLRKHLDSRIKEYQKHGGKLKL